MQPVVRKDLVEMTGEAIRDGGLLSGVISGYRSREGQLDIAAAWATTIEENGILVAEASTGIGKTFAYLVPAVLSGKKVIVATGTKNLQDQIACKDAPLLLKAVGGNTRFAVLKGRRNYVCVQRAKAYATTKKADGEPSGVREAILSFLSETETGDISECHELPENSLFWRDVVSHAEDCRGAECPSALKCHMLRAKNRAAAANVVITNHHLLFAAVATRAGGGSFSDILPDADIIVLDEAHGIEDVAGEAFGACVTSAEVRDILYGFRKAYSRNNKVYEAAVCFQKAADAMFDGIPARHERHGVDMAVSGPLCEAAYEAGKRLSGTLRRKSPKRQSVPEEAEAMAKSVDRFCESLYSIVRAKSGRDVVWCERNGKTVCLNATPIDVSGILRDHFFAGGKAMLLTSATLSVSGNPSYFLSRIGLSGNPCVKSVSADSGFDYKSRVIYYTPDDIPLPNEKGFAEAVACHSERLLAASGGGGLVLCTSFRVMKTVTEHLRASTKFRVLCQGDAPRRKILDDFRSDRDAVLVATSSFWEGVDVPGESLRCLIIDKIPFSAPDDPVASSRANALKASGLNPFSCYHLPEAVLTLKQGVGRLMRRHEDFGVIAILDRRMFTKEYGKTLKSNLPDAPYTRKESDVYPVFSLGLAGKLTEEPGK